MTTDASDAGSPELIPKEVSDGVSLGAKEAIALAASRGGEVVGARFLEDGRRFSADIRDDGSAHARFEGDRAVGSAAQSRDTEFQHSFCDLGTQYYICARQAARAWLMPVHGNLFHHAVEMFLKAALVGTLTIEEMKGKKYSHRLPALWDQFKAKERDSTLARFDSTVTALHAFDSIRYPNEIVEKGMLVTVVWRPEDVDTGTRSGKMPPKYEFVIAEVDSLVIDVLDRTRLNPKAFCMGMVHGPGVREALVYENAQAARWL